MHSAKQNGAILSRQKTLILNGTKFCENKQILVRHSEAQWQESTGALMGTHNYRAEQLSYQACPIDPE